MNKIHKNILLSLIFLITHPIFGQTDNDEPTTQTDTTNLKPFEHSDEAIIKEITLQDTASEVKNGNTIISGQVNLFGVTTTGKFETKKNDKGLTAQLLEIEMPNGWKLSQAAPWQSLKGTIFDAIELDDLILFISSDDFEDTDRELTFKKGFNIVAKTKLVGPLLPISDFTGTKPETVFAITGYIAPNVTQSIFTAPIPIDETKTSKIINSDKVSIGNLELEIGGQPASFSLVTKLVIKPTPADDPLTFDAHLRFDPPYVNIDGIMHTRWKHPLGMKGIKIEDVSTQFSTNVVTKFPRNLTLAGGMTVGKTLTPMSITIPTSGNADLIMYGTTDALTLADLADTANHMTHKILASTKLADVQMQNVKMYVTPQQSTQIDVNLQPGLTAIGDLTLLSGIKAHGVINVSKKGLTGKAFCTELAVGPLKLLKSDMETDTEKIQRVDLPPQLQNGPFIQITLTPDKQETLIIGRLELPDIFVERQSFLTIAHDGVTFDITTGLGKEIYGVSPLLLAHVQGSLPNSHENAQFTVSIDFLENTQKYLLEQINAVLKTKSATETGQSASILQTVQQKASATIEAARKTAQGALAAVGAATKEGITAAVQSQAKEEDESVSKFEIPLIHYTGTLQELASGKLTNVQCTIKIFGAPQDFSFDLAIDKPQESLQELANKISEKISEDAKGIKLGV